MIGLEGYVSASYAELVAAFGPPNDSDGMDDYKSQAQWCLTAPSGQEVFIYDWKKGPGWTGRPQPPEEVTDWNIASEDGHSGRELLASRGFLLTEGWRERWAEHREGT